MKGKNHEDLNLALLPFITFLIGVFGSRKYQLIILSFLILFFVIRYLIATFVGTPDLDTISRATKRLWIIGGFFKKCSTINSYMASGCGLESFLLSGLYIRLSGIVDGWHLVDIFQL